ncbi:MAG TPA: ribbon-helix-helix domain-containing protein [Candidatus Binataceae bacterium]|nr:ribbon-helix-helix domain-containing protein [Candidatus Binataceae bacterium]
MSKQRATLGATGVFATVSKSAKAIEAKPLARPDRVGRAPLPFWATSAAKKQLRMLAAEHDTTQQDLMTEALKMLFEKYHRPPIA